MKTVKLPSWSAFEEAVRGLSQRREDLKLANEGWQFEPLVYRGLANSKWELETTLERACPNEAATPIMSNYYRHVYAIKKEIRRAERRKGKMGKAEKPPKDLWSKLPKPLTFDKSLQQVGQSEPLLFFKRKAWYRFLVYLPVAERLVALTYLDKMNYNSLNLLGAPDDLVRTFARRELLLRN